jgi:5-methyltetrahydropteroyltriglutamate--homocysteine methyltransferase
LIFVDVTDPNDPKVESVEEIPDCILMAAKHLPPGQLGTTDNRGFSPFTDDRSTSRDTAFMKIANRVAGTRLAEQALG